jgi:mannosyltransferase OCH1-like enzyme
MKHKNIFQIVISDVEPSAELLDSTKQKILDVYKGHDYVLYTDEHIKDFLLDYDPELLQVYQKLKPYAFRADLARYCLLERFGGWYFDISLHPNFYYANDRPAVFFYNPNRKLIENCVMYCDPGNVLLQNVLEKIKHNVTSNYYGDTAICITGPQALTNEFNKLDRTITKKFTYGAFNSYECKDLALRETLTIDGKNFVNYKKHGQFGIVHLGIQGTNIYHHMWENRNIYHD